MCLCEILEPKVRNEIKNSIGKDGTEVYKLVGVKNEKYYPLYTGVAKCGKKPYKQGVNEANTDSTIGTFGLKYKAGFHFIRDKKLAQKAIRAVRKYFKKGTLNPSIFRGEYKVITCVVKKSWITQIGKEHMAIEMGLENVPVMIAKKAIFPKFSKR